MKLITRLVAAHHIRQARRRIVRNRRYMRKVIGHA